MAGKRNCSLFCAPMPIARLIQLFPKFALVFFVIHFSVMIYSFFSPNPHAAKSKEVPPGVVDVKMKHVNTEYIQRMNSDFRNNTFNKKNDTALRKAKSKSLILQRLRPDGYQGNPQDDSKRPSALKKRSAR